MILTVHVVVIGGMLLQGCKDTKDNTTSTTSTTDTTAAAATNTDTLPPVTSATNMSNNTAVNPAPAAPVTGQQPPAIQPMPTAVPPVQPAPVVPTVAAPAAAGASEYVIASGDTLGAIAKKNGVSLKALIEANPGINPKKLQIGHKVQIPAGGGVAAPAASPATPGADVASTAAEAPALYTVKSGDTLGKIAKAHHTSVKKIMALNDMKTTSIKVAQKLKLPASAAATNETPAAPTAVAPAPVTPMPAPATPVATSAPAPVSNQ
jgi:peptidoglycan endopeptidase LytE